MRDLVLVGGGHAHVQVLRRWMMAPLPDTRVTVVLDRAEAAYSGMVPGFVAGDYRAPELEIDVVPLARRARARVVLAPALRVDPEQRRIELEGRPAIAYDVASLDVGSSVRGLDLPGVAEHALATRPIRSLVDRLEARLAALPGPEVRVTVVGGGAAGIELAFTLEARLRADGRAPRVRVVGDSAEVLPGAHPRLARAARREAETRGIAVQGGVSVTAVEKDRLLCGGADAIPSDLVVWAAGAAPPELLAASPLPKNPHGFLRVDDALAVPGCPGLFAAGDCAVQDTHPDTPRAGVYAVRQAPVLDANLRAALGAGRARPYRPQRSFLALLNLGEGRALGGKWGFVARGRAVWRLKDTIDRRFVRRFQVLDEAGAPSPHFPTPESMGMEEMECGGCAAKLDAGALGESLAALPAAPRDTSVRLGLEQPDDAAALALPGGDVLLATVDGFRAFADDPWLVGRVAAVNAVSDVSAMGGRARHALALVTVPDTEPRRGAETLRQVLAGVRAALDPLGVALVGGHTTRGDALFVGLSILGALERGGEPLSLAGAAPGERLLLTRPLGTGVVLAADMAGRARGAWVRSAHASMLRDNAAAAEVARACGAGACTDVSGFGLGGHLLELLRASGVAARIDLDALPVLPGALELLQRGVRSSFHAQNTLSPDRLGCDPAAVLRPELALLADPQTSGGLLFSLAAERCEEALARLREAGDGTAAEIGELVPAEPGAPPLRVR